MDTQKQLHENISALADGELKAAELELTLAALDTAEGRAAWNAYHQIGHTLRSDACGLELSADFSARLARRLAAEPPLRGPAAARARAKPAPQPAEAASDAGATSGAPAATATTLP